MQRRRRRCQQLQLSPSAAPALSGWLALLLLLLASSSTGPAAPVGLAVAAAASTPAASQQAPPAAAVPVAEPPSFCRLGGAAAGADAADAQAAAGAAAADAYGTATAGPTDMVWGGDMLKAYRNLFFHNKKWYAVVEPGSDAGSIDAGISLNAQLTKLPTTDSSAFQANLKACYVPGVTLLLDFPFPAFPDNLGHWAEVLLPLHSAFSSPHWQQLLQGSSTHIDRLLLLNVRQQLLYSWPREVLGLALNPALPPWPLPADGQASSSSRSRWYEALPWERPLPPIINPVDYEAWSASGWLVFENVVVLYDRYPIVSLPEGTRPPRPQRSQAAAAGAAEGRGSSSASTADSGLWANEFAVGFNQPRLAATFRAEALARHGWDRPLTAGRQQQQEQQQQAASITQQQCQAGAGGGVCDASIASSSSSSSSIPRTVTVLWYPEDYPPVTNHRQLVAMLEELTEPYGLKVRTVSLTMGAPFLSHMATMADTGILVGRHGPLLATAVLLPPGAAVLELLPYKWEWRGVSQLYHNMTRSTGRLHHWAWRPLDAKWCKYKEPADARYAGWLPQECQGRECVLVHAQAGLEVDLAAVRSLLARKLPGLLAGESVEQLREPWPAAE